MVQDQRKITVVVTENKGFLITVTMENEVPVNVEANSNNRFPFTPRPAVFTDTLYIASRLDEAMEIIKFHTEAMLSKKE